MRLNFRFNLNHFQTAVITESCKLRINKTECTAPALNQIRKCIGRTNFQVRLTNYARADT